MRQRNSNGFTYRPGTSTYVHGIPNKNLQSTPRIRPYQKNNFTHFLKKTPDPQFANFPFNPKKSLVQPPMTLIPPNKCFLNFNKTLVLLPLNSLFPMSPFRIFFFLLSTKDTGRLIPSFSLIFYSQQKTHF